MTLAAPTRRGRDLRDEYGHRAVRASAVPFRGRIWDVRRDTVDLGGAGGVVEREFIEHPGAVIVVALRSGAASSTGADEIFLLRQYRHPVGVDEWELPAGLLDVAGEPPPAAAARELAEEADLRAARWHVLVDFHPSAGAMSEAIRVYLARDLADVPVEQRHVRTAEEADLTAAWVDLDEAQAAVLAGRIGNAGAVVGILAAHAARASGWATLRPPDAPWPQHPAYRDATGADTDNVADSDAGGLVARPSRSRRTHGSA